MTSEEKKVQKLRELLQKVIAVNDILLNFYNLPVLRKVNAEIQKVLKGM